MEINLIPQVPKEKKYFWPITIVLFIVVVSLCILVGFQLYEKKEYIDEKQMELINLTKERGIIEEEVNIVSDDSELIINYLDEVDYLNANNIDWLPLLDELSIRLPFDAKLVNANITSNNLLSISGMFKTIESVGEYIQLLDQIEWIEEAQFISSEADIKEDQSVEYYVVLKIIINSYSFNTEGGA